MWNTPARAAMVPLLAMLLACAPTAPASKTGDAPPPRPRPNRTVTLIARAEPGTLGARPLTGGTGGTTILVAPFNASLDDVDENGAVIPSLAEALPQLHTDSWRVYPDGRMETTYRLRPNLTWQDGAPLTADDFVFALRVYQNPSYGSSGPPTSYMDEITAPDARNLVIRWRQPYPDAGVLGPTGFPPLPRHILEAQYRELDALGFASLPFWIRDYVGLGAYRIDQWEPGSFFEATAFDGYVMGRPKIDRMRMVFMGDTNTALATMLSGEAHYVTDFVLYYEDGLNLEREWKRENGGTVHWFPNLLRITNIQVRSDLANPALLRDVRVRKALAHGIDINEGFEVITGGKGAFALAPMTLDDPFYPAVEKAVARYPYDPARARQLLEDVGLSRGSDGFYRTAAGDPLSIEYSFILQASNERETSIFVDSLRRVGIDASTRAFTAVQIRDAQLYTSFPGLNLTNAGNAFWHYLRGEIPTAANRYSGKNYTGWENAEFERLYNSFSSTLEPSERERQAVALARIWSEELPTIPHYFTPVVNGWSAQLVGVAPRTRSTVAPLGHMERWDWKS